MKNFILLILISIFGLVVTTKAAQPPKISNLSVEQLHQSYQEVPHRYRLTLNIQGGVEPFKFEWKINCGTLVTPSNLPTVEWHYNTPGECANAKVVVAVLDSTGWGQILTQDVFDESTKEVQDIKSTKTFPDSQTKAEEQAGLNWGLIAPLGIGVFLIGLVVLAIWIRVFLRKTYEDLLKMGDCGQLEKELKEQEDILDQTSREINKLSGKLKELQKEDNNLKIKINQTKRDLAKLQPQEGKAFVESGGIRLTEKDLTLRRKAAKEAWQRYKVVGGGKDAAERLEEEWEELGEHQALEKLRKADLEFRQKTKKDLSEKLNNLENQKTVIEKETDETSQSLSAAKIRIASLEKEVDNLRELVKKCRNFLKEKQDKAVTQVQNKYQEQRQREESHKLGHPGTACLVEDEKRELSEKTHYEIEFLDPTREIKMSYPNKENAEKYAEDFESFINFFRGGIKLLPKETSLTPPIFPVAYWNKMLDVVAQLIKTLREREAGILGIYNEILIPVSVYRVTISKFIICQNGVWQKKEREEIVLKDKSAWHQLEEQELYTPEQAALEIEKYLRELKNNQERISES